MTIYEIFMKINYYLFMQFRTIMWYIRLDKDYAGFKLGILKKTYQQTNTHFWSSLTLGTQCVSLHTNQPQYNAHMED